MMNTELVGRDDLTMYGFLTSVSVGTEASYVYDVADEELASAGKAGEDNDGRAWEAVSREDPASPVLWELCDCVDFSGLDDFLDVFVDASFRDSSD